MQTLWQINNINKETFPFTTIETMEDFYLGTWYIRVPLGAAKRF